MKKLLIIIFLLTGTAYAQTVATATTSFNTVVDLKTRIGTEGVQVLVNGLSTINDGNGGSYMWSGSSAVADNGFTVIQVTSVNTGRWLRISNANTVKGTTTFSATVLQTAYVVNHGLPFMPLQVYIQAKTSNAAVPSWVDTINSTSFTVHFASVPILGTNNITIDYLVIKQ